MPSWLTPFSCDLRLWWWKSLTSQQTGVGLKRIRKVHCGNHQLANVWLPSSLDVWRQWFTENILHLSFLFLLLFSFLFLFSFFSLILILVSLVVKSWHSKLRSCDLVSFGCNIFRWVYTNLVIYQKLIDRYIRTALWVSPFSNSLNFSL